MLAYTFQQYATPADSGLTVNIAGSITPAGAVTNDLNANSISLGGSLTPDGQLDELLIGLNDGQLEGTIALSGSLSNSLQVLILDPLDGQISPFGNLNLRAHIVPSGSITPVGTLDIPTLFLNNLAGTITPNGSLASNDLITGNGLNQFIPILVSVIN